MNDGRKTLLTVEQFRELARPTSIHLDEEAVRGFIRECEDAYIIPAIGYRQFKGALECENNTPWDDKFDDTDSLYGVEKPDWEEFISSEKGKAYLTAWRSVVESAGVVINEEMSYVDAGYADPISDRFYEERKAIEKALHGELAPSEEAKPFIKPLLENYHKRFPLDLLYEHYGWDNDSVYTALAENISDPVLNEYAVDTVTTSISTSLWTKSWKKSIG